MRGKASFLPRRQQEAAVSRRLGLAFVLVFMLAACGSAGPGGEGVDNASPISGTEAQDTSQPGAQGDTTGITENEIIVGSIQPLSGPHNFYGEWANSGIQAAIERINADGGINGRQLRYVVADQTSCTAAETGVAEARRLIQEENVFLFIGTQCGVVVRGVTDTLLAGTKIVNLSITGAGLQFGSFNAEESGYTFFFNPNTATQLAAMSNFAFQELDPKPSTVGFIGGTDNYGTDALIGVKAALEAQDQALAATATIDQTSKDAAVQVAQMKQAGVDTVLLATLPDPTSAILSEALQQDYHPRFLGSLASGTQNIFTALPAEAYANFYAAATVPFAKGGQDVNDFLAPYHEHDPDLNYDNVQGIGITELMAEYLRIAGEDITREAFIDAMFSNTVENDVFGEIELNPTRAEGNRSISVIRYEEGAEQVIVATSYSPEVPIPGIDG